MASCMEKTAAWVLEIPVVQDARRFPALDKKYRKGEGIIHLETSSILLLPDTV